MTGEKQDGYKNKNHMASFSQPLTVLMSKKMGFERIKFAVKGIRE